MSIKINPSYEKLPIPIKVEFDPFGNPIQETDNGQAKKITDLANDCYKNQMNKVFGISELVALFEAFSGALLGFFMPSPATWTNALTSFGEYGQVLIARTTALGDTTPAPENASEIEKEEAKERIKTAEERREGAMAWMQLGAGSLGAISNVLDFVRGDSDTDIQELSVLKKVGLSIASFASAVCMFFGWGEKTLMSTISKNGPESENMRMNADSDFRCFLEWSSMTVYPWVRGFKLARKALDIIIPYLAIRNGIGHLIREGVSKIINNDKSLPLESYIGKGFTKTLSSLFLINTSKKDKEENDTVPSIFYSKWFLGDKEDNGFRSKYLLPTLKFFGCNSPNVWLQDKNLVIEYPSSKETLVQPGEEKPSVQPPQLSTTIGLALN